MIDRIEHTPNVLRCGLANMYPNMRPLRVSSQDSAGVHALPAHVMSFAFCAAAGATSSSTPRWLPVIAATASARATSASEICCDLCAAIDLAEQCTHSPLDHGTRGGRPTVTQISEVRATGVDRRIGLA